MLNTAQQPFVGEKHDATLQKDEQESLFVAEEPVIEVDQQSLPEGCNVNPQGKIKGVSSVELGLTRGFQPVLVQVSEECCKLLPEHRDRLRRELETVFKACAKLSFLKVQYQLVQFLKNRYNAPAPKAQVIPHTWETDDPRIIFNNLQTLDMHSIETKIHRVYGRMRLHAVIQEKAARGDKSTLAELIQEIVSGAGNPASSEEMTRIVDKCSYEYYAGRRWLEVSLMFRGMGVVLVFIVAGMFAEKGSHLGRSPYTAPRYLRFAKLDRGADAEPRTHRRPSRKHPHARSTLRPELFEGLLRKWVSASGDHCRGRAS